MCLRSLGRTAQCVANTKASAAKLLLAARPSNKQQPLIRQHTYTSPAAGYSRGRSGSTCAQAHSSSGSAMVVAEGVYALGPGTLQIDRQAFHGPLRAAVAERMRDKVPEPGIAVLQVRE